MTPRDAGAPRPWPPGARAPTADDVQDARDADAEDEARDVVPLERRRRQRFNGPSMYFDGPWD